MTKYCMSHFENQDTGYKMDISVYLGGRYWNMDTREYCIADVYLDISGKERGTHFYDTLQMSHLRIAEALRDEHCGVRHMSGNKTRYHVKILFNGGVTSVEAIENRLEQEYRNYAIEHPNNRYNHREYYHYVREDLIHQVTVHTINGYMMEQAVSDLSCWVINSLYDLLIEAGVFER